MHVNTYYATFYLGTGRIPKVGAGLRTTTISRDPFCLPEGILFSG